MQRVILLRVAEFEAMGWVGGDAFQRRLLDAIERAGPTTAVWDLPFAEALDGLVQELGPGDVVWPNAYHVRDTHGTVRELVALLEARGVPTIGSGARAMATVLHKDRCQAALRAAGVPVPAFAVLDGPDAPAPVTLPPMPVLVKPTGTAGSLGIDRDGVCHTPDEAIARARKLAAIWPGPVLIEQFLPGVDVTVAAVGNDPRWTLLATEYRVADRPPAQVPLDRAARVMRWGGIKSMAVVRDPALLRQIEEVVPRICAVLGLRDVTRVDGRTDAQGRWRVFDVNGMPALEVPESVIVEQWRVCSPDGDVEAAFDGWVARILAAAAARIAAGAGPGVSAPAR